MTTYLYELPTTGAISFTDFCVDQTASYTTSIADLTQARANLRAALKESKRADGEKDFLRLVKAVDDYLPHLYGIKACFDAEEIVLSSEPVFSWRSTLSANHFNTSPRQSVPSLHADLAFTLLTYAFVLSNLARVTVASLGRYECERAISEVERKAKDDKLNFSVVLLCRACGVFKHLSEKVLPEWDKGESSSHSRPPDVTQEVTNALAKMALADAQQLAIRKLLSKSAYDNTISPGPPLPKSHPSPALIAKLFLECSELYSSARALAKTPGASHAKSKGRESDEVTPALRHYLADTSALCGALAHKWLGVDAGENGGRTQGGAAVAFLGWAKSELEELRDGRRGVVNFDRDRRETRELMKGRIAEELESVVVFWKHYKKMNDSLHFQPVPRTSELQTVIPAGRTAVAAKPFTPPPPAFGPGSVEHARHQAELLELNVETDDVGENRSQDRPPIGREPSYAGAGSYF
ncbi:BRO1 domain-containing protein [Phellopilus nigrolimitatus]|nr:BRO1 domain-containing protein [Phellopilus nigrolimitatus]